MKDALQTTPRKGSRLSAIGIWTAVIGVVLAALSGLGARGGFLSPFASMGAYTAGSLLLFIALITAGLGLLRSSGTAGTASGPATWLALLAGLAITANNGLVMAQARGAPAIHDISTDTDNPPAFVAVVPLRAIDAQNPPEYAGPAAAAAQKQAFPDLQPLRVSQPANVVFAAAKALVADKGWTLVDANEAEGRIEATAATGWVRFKDDVVIRIQPERDQTRVDVRSKSRVGRGDMGANARRVRDYLAALRGKLAG
ncbi:MAG: DUF1499 domain-containing protein [Gammaproteobacteria bacterium]